MRSLELCGKSNIVIKQMRIMNNAENVIELFFPFGFIVLHVFRTLIALQILILTNDYATSGKLK